MPVTVADRMLARMAPANRLLGSDSGKIPYMDPPVIASILASDDRSSHTYIRHQDQPRSVPG